MKFIIDVVPPPAPPQYVVEEEFSPENVFSEKFLSMNARAMKAIRDDPSIGHKNFNVIAELVYQAMKSTFGSGVISLLSRKLQSKHTEG